MKTGVVAFSVLFGCSAYSAGAGATDCPAEAEALAKAKSELPQIDTVPPRHREVVCITLETVIDFASKLKAHVAHCPGSDFAQAVADWDRTRADFAKRFSQRRCRRHP